MLKLLVLFLCLAFVIQLIPWDKENVVDVSASIVLISEIDGYSFGSGSVIGPNSVLTARHVADQENLVIQTSTGVEYFIVDKILDQDSDVAILIIDGIFDVPILEISEEVLRVGDEIVVYGTPADKDFFPCRLPGNVLTLGVELDYQYIVQPNMFLVDAHTWGGCSGGPVMFGDKIVGVWTAYNQRYLLSFAIPVVEFQEILPNEN